MTIPFTAFTAFAADFGSFADAAEAAIAQGWTLCMYNSPVEDAREGLTVEEAVAIAREDAGLLYLTAALLAAELRRLDAALAREIAAGRRRPQDHPWFMSAPGIHAAEEAADSGDEPPTFYLDWIARFRAILDTDPAAPPS